MPLPPVAVVDGDGVLPGQVGNVQGGVGSLADAVLRLPARVPRVIDVSALMFQHNFDRLHKSLILHSLDTANSLPPGHVQRVTRISPSPLVTRRITSISFGPNGITVTICTE